MLYENIGTTENGHLSFCNLDTVSLAKKYGTPLYLIDENGVRTRCETYKNAMNQYFGPGSFPIYASKALSFKGMYRITAEENIGADVSSGGELYTAIKAGFPPEKIFFHGNNKTEAEISMAMDFGIGFFICDNFWELENINEIAGKKGIRQKVLLRLTPGIDPHTLEAISTGKVDSKFGVAIETGQAEQFVKLALDLENIDLKGYHSHVGSQVFDGKSFVDAAEILLCFAEKIKETYGYTPEYLDLGGGMGVPYFDKDGRIDYVLEIKLIAEKLKAQCKKFNLSMPNIILEPGRSIVADNGITLYTVGGRKEIPGFKNYISIDGGMTDNPRYALYGAIYTVLLANRIKEKPNYVCTVAGRCCESGDLIQENVSLPRPERGDIIAVLTTGAYNYSMASNYNRVPRPPVVMIKDGVDYLAVKRESFDDLIRNDL